MVQFTIWWTDHFIWSGSKILSNIINRRRPSAPVRHKSRSSILHWIRIERGEKLEWWPFESGYRWSANNSTIWNSWKKIQHQRRRKEILKRNGDIVFPCKTDEIVQAWQPLSTAVYKAESDPTRKSQDNSSDGKEEARDPDPDVEIRQYFRSIVGIYTFRNHVAPR